MAEGRLIWCGPLREGMAVHPETAPPPLGPHENSRWYSFPRMGFQRLWPVEGQPVDDQPLQKGTPYALLVIPDCFETYPSNSEVVRGPNNEPMPKWEKRQILGDHRAQDLARRWNPWDEGQRTAGWGVVAIAGQAPTAAEYEMACERRKVYLQRHFEQAVRSYKMAQAGKPGKAVYDLSDLLVAEELGRKLPDVLTAADAAPADEEMKACPFCAETIKAAAKVCRFCNRELEEMAAAGGGKKR
jgi:hypothetical protein